MKDTAWGDGHHYDLRIVNDDIALLSEAEPLTLDGRPSIAQDIGHAIRESNLLLELVGERSPLRRRATHQKIEVLVEEDLRVIPGTARMSEPKDAESPWIQAKTYEYGEIGFYL